MTGIYGHRKAKKMELHGSAYDKSRKREDTTGAIVRRRARSWRYAPIINGSIRQAISHWGSLFGSVDAQSPVGVVAF